MMIAITAALLAAVQEPRCPNWRGWDADRRRDICGPAVRPLTAAELSAYEARWESGVRSAAQAEYVYSCGLRSAHWYSSIQGQVDFGMMRDPRYSRLSAAQREAVTSWRIRVRSSAANLLGRRGCGAVRDWPYLVTLDRLARAR